MQVRLNEGENATDMVMQQLSACRAAWFCRNIPGTSAAAFFVIPEAFPRIEAYASVLTRNPGFQLHLVETSSSRLS